MSKESPRPLSGDTDELKIMRDRFKLADEADQPQAQREKDDISFEDGNQWETNVQLARKGQQSTNGSDPIPARPTVVVNKLKEPVRQILNGERASDLGLELVPAEDFGDLGVMPDDTEVTTREGLTRRIQRDSIASDARRWAFKRAVIAGRGYYMVMTRYLPGKTNDQEVYVHRIFDQSAVKLDPAHTDVAGADADWGFMGTWMAWDKFKAKHKKDIKGKNNPFADSPEQDFMAMAEDYPQWYQGSDTIEHAVRIVDYYYRVYQPRCLATLKDGSLEWKDEVEDQDLIEETRDVDDSVIKYRQVAGGIMVLSETDWPSPLMPFIKVIGDEVLPYDEQRRYNGVVRPARDSQVAENYMISKFVETTGLTPVNATYVDPDSIDGYEEQWKQANARPGFPLPVRTWDDNGRAFNPPARLPADPNILPLAQGIQLFDQMIQSTTGGSASDRVGAGRSVQSAKAINQLQQEDQFNTSNFLDNLARSAEYEAKVINSLLYPIYGARPGRLVRAMNGDGEMAPMVIQGDQPKGQAQQPPQPAMRGGKPAQMGKLTKDASFNVIIKITKNAENRRLQEATALGELIGAEPELMTWFGDLYLNTSDIPQRKQLAKRAKVMLTPPIQAMLAAEEKGGTFDPVASAENVKLKEQLQHAEQAMQELSQAANTEKTKITIEQIKADSDLKLEQERARTDVEKARMDNATKMYVADVNARIKGVQMMHDKEHEAFALAHATVEGEAAREADAEGAEADRMHDAATQAASAGVQAEQVEGDRQFQAEQSDADRQMAMAQTEPSEEPV